MSTTTSSHNSLLSFTIISTDFRYFLSLVFTRKIKWIALACRLKRDTYHHCCISSTSTGGRYSLVDKTKLFQKTDFSGKRYYMHVAHTQLCIYGSCRHIFFSSFFHKTTTTTCLNVIAVCAVVKKEKKLVKCENNSVQEATKPQNIHSFSAKKASVFTLPVFAGFF